MFTCSRFLSGLVLLFLLTPFSLGDDYPAPFKEPFRNARDDPPAPNVWSGRVFQLSRAYPTTPPPAEPRPWEAINFRTHPERYLRTVLKYCLEGNTAASIDWQQHEKPAASRWYHAPWMHASKRFGREFINGLTRERPSEPGELHELQTREVENWGVSLYNPLGGYGLGKVWKDPHAPDLDAVDLPVGTVAIKLLFTRATARYVPYLRRAKSWDGHVKRDDEPYVQAAGSGAAPRNDQVSQLNLLQIDVAVREDRSYAPTGWVFGTFVYNGDAEGDSAYDRMVPLGLMWGNNPNVTQAAIDMGTKLDEGWINKGPEVPKFGPKKKKLGWAGRVNGPVDNPRSSCLSCHSTAQAPKPENVWKDVPNLAPREDPEHPSDPTVWSKKYRYWFRNLGPTEPFNDKTRSLGYSLQLRKGMQNRAVVMGELKLERDDDLETLVDAEGRRVFMSNRDGRGEIHLKEFPWTTPNDDNGASNQASLPRTSTGTAAGLLADAPTHSRLSDFLLGGVVGLLVGAALVCTLPRRGSKKGTTPC